MSMLQESLDLEQRIACRAPARLRRLLAAADRAAIGFMERYLAFVIGDGTVMY